MFVGYQEWTKGFRLWERQSGGIKIIISRDVIFNEAIFPCKIINTEETNIPRRPDDFTILEGSQIEIEQAVGNNNLPVAPIEPDLKGVPVLDENQTFDHDDDQEE